MPYARRRRGSLVPYVAVATVGALIALLMNRHGMQPAAQGPRGDAGQGVRGDSGQGGGRGLAAISPKVAAEAGDAAGPDYVRPAGPEAMRDAPRRGWDKLDEASDESFPASDPPATY